MKKKILVLSLAANLIAGAFIFYAFTSNTKNVNDAGGGYVVMTEFLSHNTFGNSEISVSDGNSTLERIDLKPEVSSERNRSNNQAIAKEMNQLKSQGYELVSSNFGGSDGLIVTNYYVFVKK